VRAVTSVVLGLLAGCAAAPTGDGQWSVGPATTHDEIKADDLGGPRAELKVLVDEEWIDDVRDRLGLDHDLAQERAVWFYDSADLALFDAGVILRARSVHGDDDDSTVKVRPLAADQVDPVWFQQAGFKCELDATPASSVSSCSFTTEQEEDQIEEADGGERDVDTLFSSEQEDFLAAFGPLYLDWDELAPLGPIDALVWKLESYDLPAPLTAERWRLPDSEMLELSIKVDEADGDAAMEDFLAWLADRGVPLSAEQESKTRRALEALRAD
jgi:hypothetical protein